MMALLARGVGVRRGRFGRHQFADLARVEQRPAQRLRAGEELRLLIGGSDQRRDGEDGVRLGKTGVGFEGGAIGGEGRGRRRRR